MENNEYFFKTDHLLIWRPVGILNARKIYEFVNFIDENSKIKDPHFHRFVDLSHIAGYSVKYDELRPIAKVRKQYYDTKLTHKIKMAFLIKNPLSFGLARMYQVLSSNNKLDLKVYQTMEEVSKFLEIDISILSE